MTPGTDTGLKAFPDNRKIMLHSLFSCHLQLVKNVVVRAADKYACLFHANLFYKFKILFAGPDPAGDLRELISLLHALIYSVPVFLAVQEKFTLPDLSVGSAQSVEIIVNIYNLLCAVRRPGLLSIPECRVCDPYLIRHAVGYDPVVEGNLRHLVIVKKISEYIGFFHIHQWVHMLLKLKQICVFVKVNFPVLHVSSLLFFSRIIVYNYTNHVNKKST